MSHCEPPTQETGTPPVGSGPRLPLSEKGKEARCTYLECLMSLGFTLLKLHRIETDGDCTCHPMSTTRGKNQSERLKARAEGVLLPCKVPGKHPAHFQVEGCVVTDLQEMGIHLDQGGGIGMVLRVKDLRRSSLRVIAYDCDRLGAAEWLKARGIESPWEVYGRGGKHVFGLLPSDAPDFYSNTNTLNPGRNHPTSEEQPGIDIKTSGHLVVAFSPFKRLVLNGKDVSEDPEAIRAFFKDEAAVRAILPEFDPRVLVPEMHVYQPGNALHKAMKGKRSLVRILSTKKPSKEEITGPYRKLPYNERKTYARCFVAVRAKDPIGSGIEKAAYRTICILLCRFFLSERDAFELMRDRYNRRCRTEDHKPAPLRVRKLAYMVLCASQRDLYDPMQNHKHYDKGKGSIEAGVNKRLQRLDRRNLRANQKRAAERGNRRGSIQAGVDAFFTERCRITEDEGDVVLFPRLLDAYQAWAYRSPYEPDVPPGVFGAYLNLYGLGRKSKKLGGKKVLLVTRLVMQ